jgi:hypothetical protein
LIVGVTHACEFHHLNDLFDVFDAVLVDQLGLISPGPKAQGARLGDVPIGVK